MLRVRSLMAVLVILFASEKCPSAEPKLADASPGVLEVIPADVVGAIGIRSVNDLTKRGDRLIEAADVKSPMRLTDAYRFVATFLGLHRGLDEDGSAALMLLNEKVDEAAFVLAVPIADLEAMAGNFKLTAKDLAEGKVIDRREREGKDVFPYANHIAHHNRHLYLGGSVENIRAATQGKSLGETLSVSDRRSLAKDDIVFYANRSKMDETWKFMADEIERQFQRLEGESSAQLRQVAAAVDDWQSVVAGVRLEEGFGSTVLLKFRGEKSREILTLLQGNEIQANLSSLPLGRVLAAHASSGDGESSGALVRSLMLTGLPIDERLFISATHRPNIAGVFGEVWQRLQGSRSALYENENPERDGQFSLVAILETEDADQFLADVTSLATFVNAATLAPNEVAAAIDGKTLDELVAMLGHDEYRVRQLATTKLGLIGEPAFDALKIAAVHSKDVEVQFRAAELCAQMEKLRGVHREELLKHDLLSQLQPKFAFFPKQETVAERPVDIVQMKLRDEEAMYVPQLRSLFGPQWSKLRLAKVDNRIVMLVGSRTEILEQAIQGVAADKPGLRSAAMLAAFEERSDPRPTATLHLRLAQLQAGARRESNEDAGVTSLGITIAPQQLRFDLFAPLDEVKAVVAEFNRLNGW